MTSIGKEAFYGCFALTSIVIPESVTSIGEEAFYGCSALTAITVSEDNPVYDSREECNAIIETASNTLIAGCMSTIIPSSVTSIGSNAFRSCSSLTSINIPESVTSIGTEAFYYCSALTTVICHAEKMPKLDPCVFGGVPQSKATLYVRKNTKYKDNAEIGNRRFTLWSKVKFTFLVRISTPASALEAYKAADQWKDFGTILPIEGNEDIIDGIDSPAAL